MLEPFMRLFGIDDNDPPVDTRRDEAEKRGPEAVLGPQTEGTGVLTDGSRRKSETETELERAANARQ